MRKTESSNGRSKLKTYLILAVLPAYPAFIHSSFALDRPQLVAGMWLALSAVGSTIAVRRQSGSSTLIFGALLTVAIALSLFFIVEYQLRLHCLSNHEHLSFRAFCHLLASTDLRILAR